MKKVMVKSLLILFGLILVLNVFVLIQTTVPSVKASLCPEADPGPGNGYIIELHPGWYCICDPNYFECCCGD